MTTETNAERMAHLKSVFSSLIEIDGNMRFVFEQAERARELEKTIIQRESFIETLHAVHFKELQGEKAENDRLKLKIEELRAMLRYAKSNSIKIIKERNNRATVIEYNGERYVYQSDTTARGGVRSGKQPHKGQAYKK